MAKDLSSTVRDVVTHVARDAMKNLGDATPAVRKPKSRLSGPTGVAAGAGLAAMVPVAKKGYDAVRSGAIPASPTKMVSKAASSAGGRVGGQVKDAVSSKVDQAGGAGGIAKEAASGLLPFGGGDDKGGSKGGVPGVGKGRRMPVQQSVDVAVPIETAYNQWTRYEDWPTFMHRVTRVTQDDPCTVKFATKIWGKTKEFEAEIETQRPDERIKWRVAQGITHTGVVTFHELAPRLTRIEVTLDVDPGSLLEKAARGLRHIKRAARADLHRFKAFIEVQEHETGAWRGVIEDGELVEDHDPAYDEEHEYSDIEEIRAQAEQADDEDKDEKAGDDTQRGRTQRFKRQAESAQRSSGGGSRSSGSSGGSNSSGSRSRAAAAARSGSSRSTGGSKSGTRKRSSSGGSGGSSSGTRSSANGRSTKSSSGGTSKRTGSSTGAKRKASSRS
jgi:uncharacterized membrane protein